MIVNFRVYKINQDMYKLIQISTLIIYKKKRLDRNTQVRKLGLMLHQSSITSITSSVHSRIWKLSSPMRKKKLISCNKKEKVSMSSPVLSFNLTRFNLEVDYLFSLINGVFGSGLRMDQNKILLKKIFKKNKYIFHIVFFYYFHAFK